MPQLIYYAMLPDLIIGHTWIAVSEKGIIAIDFDIAEDIFCDSVQKKVKVEMIPGSHQIWEELKTIEDYVNGIIDTMVVNIDLEGVSPFQKAVYTATQQIPRGQVATYSEIAQRIGNPKAYRAVGQALRYNPIPIIIPCHRVVHSDGTLGGYGGKIGSQRKIALLRIEGVVLT